MRRSFLIIGVISYVLGARINFLMIYGCNVFFEDFQVEKNSKQPAQESADLTILRRDFLTYLVQK